MEIFTEEVRYVIAVVITGYLVFGSYLTCKIAKHLLTIRK